MFIVLIYLVDDGVPGVPPDLAVQPLLQLLVYAVAVPVALGLRIPGLVLWVFGWSSSAYFVPG